MSATLLSQVKALPLAERIQLGHDLWEGLIDAGYSPELTPAQPAELERRLAGHEKNPNDVVAWVRQER